MHAFKGMGYNRFNSRRAINAPFTYFTQLENLKVTFCQFSLILLRNVEGIIGLYGDN